MLGRNGSVSNFDFANRSVHMGVRNAMKDLNKLSGVISELERVSILMIH